MDDTAVPGSVSVSDGALAQLVGLTAAECYGVVGTVPRGGVVGRLLSRDRPERGVGVRRGPDGLALSLRVVVEHGLNLGEVAATIRSHVAYEVTRLTGLPVSSVEVTIADVRSST